MIKVKEEYRELKNPNWNSNKGFYLDIYFFNPGLWNPTADSVNIINSITKYNNCKLIQNNSYTDTNTITAYYLAAFNNTNTGYIFLTLEKTKIKDNLLVIHPRISFVVESVICYNSICNNGNGTFPLVYRQIHFRNSIP